MVKVKEARGLGDVAPGLLEVIAMIRQVEFRLEGATTPSGEIAAKDLVAIVSALQDLVTRVSRDVAGFEGPGRAVRHMQEYAQVRVSGISAGSTVLESTRARPKAGLRAVRA